MLDFIVALIAIIFFVALSWGIILQTRDEQALWEDRKSYNKMKKFIEENDSSKL